MLIFFTHAGGLLSISSVKQLLHNANLSQTLSTSHIMYTGIAAFGNAPTAIIPAIALISLIGLFSGYGFSLIGRVCSYTGGKSYREAWSESVGQDSSWVPAVTCTMKVI